MVLEMIFFRVLILISCTSVFAFLGFIFSIGWKQDATGFLAFIKYVILASGFLPWIVWLSLAIRAKPSCMGWPLSLAVIILVWHFILCVITAHAGGVAYAIALAVEMAIAILFFLLS